MADPLIWSKLPEHLIFYIIEQTQDTKTLRNWCEATKGRRTYYLHLVALRNRWKTFTIHRKNLLYDFEAAGHTDYFTAKRHKERDSNGEIYGAIRQPSKNLRFGVKPATLIKHLIVNSQTGYYRTRLPGEWKGLPGVNRTLELLMRHTSGLEEIIHFGPLCQQDLDHFTSHRTLTKIRLRKLHHYTIPGSYEGPEVLPRLHRSHLQISFAKLTRLSKLTVLDVSQLATREAYYLAVAVRVLAHLRRLRVSEMSDKHNNFRDSRSSPLSIFLRNLYSQGKLLYTLPAVFLTNDAPTWETPNATSHLNGPDTSTGVTNLEDSATSSDSDDRADLDGSTISADSADPPPAVVSQWEDPGLPDSLETLELVDNTE